MRNLNEVARTLKSSGLFEEPNQLSEHFLCLFSEEELKVITREVTSALVKVRLEKKLSFLRKFKIPIVTHGDQYISELNKGKSIEEPRLQSEAQKGFYLSSICVDENDPRYDYYVSMEIASIKKYLEDIPKKNKEKSRKRKIDHAYISIQGADYAVLYYAKLESKKQIANRIKKEKEQLKKNKAKLAALQKKVQQTEEVFNSDGKAKD